MSRVNCSHCNHSIECYTIDFNSTLEMCSNIECIRSFADLHFNEQDASDRNETRAPVSFVFETPENTTSLRRPNISSAGPFDSFFNEPIEIPHRAPPLCVSEDSFQLVPDVTLSFSSTYSCVPNDVSSRDPPSSTLVDFFPL